MANHELTPEPAPDEPPPLQLLADPLAPSFDRRARLVRTGDTEHVVVAERGDRIRLRVDDEWVRVLAWVHRAELRPAVARDTTASGAHRALGRGAAIRLRAGAPLAFDPRTGGASVIIDDGALTAFARVPGDALGDVWRIAASSAAADATTTPPGQVTTDAEILDTPAPGAQVLARVERRMAATAELPSPVPGWHLVTLDSPHVSVTGYVHTSAWIAGGGRIVTDTAIYPADQDGVELPEGTCLYARPGGALVGVVLVTQHDATRTARGWARWEWAGFRGRVPLYARPMADGFETCPGTLPAGEPSEPS